MNPYRGGSGLVKQHVEKLTVDTLEKNFVKAFQELIDTKRNDGFYLSSQSVLCSSGSIISLLLVFDEV